MRSYNQGRPAEQRLRFAGYDAPTEMTGAQSPRRALAALHAYLHAHLTGLELPWSWQVIDELLGDNDRWTEPAAAMDPTRSIGAHPQVPDLRVITDELRWLLACEAPALLAATSAEQLWTAQLAGRTAALGRAAHHQITEPDPETVEGALYTLPSGNHLCTAGELLSTRDSPRTRTTENPAYFTLDVTVLHELDAVLFLRDITHGPSRAVSSTGTAS